MFTKRNVLLMIVGFASMLFAGTASAVVDLAPVTTGFGDMTTAINTVGALILTAAVTAVVYKWIKGMIFS